MQILNKNKNCPTPLKASSYCGCTAIFHICMHIIFLNNTTLIYRHSLITKHTQHNYTLLNCWTFVWKLPLWRHCRVLKLLNTQVRIPSEDYGIHRGSHNPPFSLKITLHHTPLQTKAWIRFLMEWRTFTAARCHGLAQAAASPWEEQFPLGLLEWADRFWDLLVAGRTPAAGSIGSRTLCDHHTWGVNLCQ